jgi:hypothetical protein
MINRSLFRLSATLILLGLLFYILVRLFHADKANANDHTAAFTNYTNSGIWTAVHLGQFVSMAVILVGLFCLFCALDSRSILGRFAAISAGVTLALYGVLQGVDGVALKQSVDAWASAPEVEKLARFASAEAVRWLEWGLRSYESFMLGFTFILFAALLGWTAKLSRPIGYLMGLSGLAYIVQGWVIGSEGFSGNNNVPTLLAYVLILVWSVWLLVVAWRMKVSTASPNRSVSAY